MSRTTPSFSASQVSHSAAGTVSIIMATIQADPAGSIVYSALPTLPPRSPVEWRVNINIAVLASGSGTNLQALIDTQDLGAEISVVLSDRPDAVALERARTTGIPSAVLPYRDYGSRTEFCGAVKTAVEEAGVDALVLAGFMRVLDANLVAAFKDRILNIHPSLLPAFPGADAVDQALEHGVKVTGVTVHFVDEEIDHGPIIAQRAVPVLPGDDRESLHARIQVEEHDLYPRVVSAFARGEIALDGRKVIWE
jgi:phosphoribosylglycinamide formyltransferase-1